MRSLVFSAAALGLFAVAGCSATTADSVDSAQPEMLSAPTVTTIVSCADVDDPTTKGTLTVDSSYRFTWQIGDSQNRPETSTLVEVTKNVQDGGETSYSFHLASGEYISLDIRKDGTSVSFSALYAMCAAQTPVLESALAPLLAATDASKQRKQTFATCDFHGDGASVPEHDTFTVRPSLDGHGAIFEEASNEDNDQSFVLLARKVVAAGSPRRSIYEGQGGVAVFAAGQHVSSVTQLTVTSSSPASLQWNWQEKLPSSQCQVTGAAYAASLLR
jgi:hypothetical protein